MTSVVGAVMTKAVVSSIANVDAKLSLERCMGSWAPHALHDF